MSSEDDDPYESTSKRASHHDSYEEASQGKRRRIDSGSGHVLTNHTRIITPFRKLAHEDYTVGWVCALPLEMTAARTMLDEEHLSLPNPLADQNSYVLGRISNHNVVITCLPNGGYGNNLAAVAATQLMSTFKYISSLLMVGIGGGVPQPGYDIRLGDVVVGTPTPNHAAVVQYDFGKTVSNGVFEHKGNLNKPKASLLNVVSNLRSKHQLRGAWQSQMTAYIEGALRSLDQAEFAYPGAEKDILFEGECDHVPEGTSCGQCGPLKPVDRPRRQETGPFMYYGTIASGNQVIKHARTRDQLARQHGMLCFEMEGAPLVDSFSCLIIRGICDYCDSKKSKQFQGYAALAAAAYAKEFVAHLPETLQPISRNQSSPIDTGRIEHRATVMEALNFDEADSRRATVKRALPNTCKWFMDREKYCNWVDPTKYHEHHGLLWIKGKAGSGKSTLMKFLLEETNKSKTSDSIIVSFFFNARGQDLEKSTLGMYRSLVYQFLSQIPELQKLLDRVRNDQVFDEGKLDFLKNCFDPVLKASKSKNVICFVDALDECPEEQIRDMVSFFEELGNLAADEELSFRVCFSSRHYPNIVVDVGEQLILENEDGHYRDIEQYIRKNIVGKNKIQKTLQEEILLKANGIFLWVVLVVQILKRDFARGEVNQMRAKIRSVPQKLDDLFRDILTRDGNDRSRLLLCIQWTLYAKRPLNREEFYFAMKSNGDDFNSGIWNSDEIDASLMENFLLTSSKGLTELTRGKRPVVQFIHESVREFLLQPGALLNLWENFRGITEASSHDQLKECCYRQISSCSPASLGFNELPEAKHPVAIKARQAAQKLCPFLDYATSFVLYHTNLAIASDRSQAGFLNRFDLQKSTELYNGMQKHQNHRENKLQDIHHKLVNGNHFALLRDFWQTYPPDRDILLDLLTTLLESGNIRELKVVLSARFSYDLLGATKDVEHIGPILDLIADIFPSKKIRRKEECAWLLELLVDWHAIRDRSHLKRMLNLAAKRKHKAAVYISLEARAEIVAPSDELTNYNFIDLPILSVARAPRHDWPVDTFRAVSSQNQETGSFNSRDFNLDAIECMSMLLNRGATIDDQKLATSILNEASRWADERFLKFLLDQAACLPSYTQALCMAAECGNVAAVRFWIEMGASTIAQNKLGKIDLHRAGTEQVAELSIEHDSLLLFNDEHGRTPLHISVMRNFVNAVRLPLSKLTDPNVQDDQGRTPLHFACSPDVVDLLVEHGARIDIVDNQGHGPLHALARRFDKEAQPFLEDTTRALIRHGADIDLPDNQGQTALHKTQHSPDGAKVACILIHSGASIDARDARQRTPIQVVPSFTWPGPLNALHNHGAEPVIPTRDAYDEKDESWQELVKSLTRLQRRQRSQPCCALGIK